MVLRGGREEVPTAGIDTEEVCTCVRAGGGADVVAAARRKMYTCPGGSHSPDCGVPALWFCVEPSARGYLNHELPFVLCVREMGVVDDNRAMSVPQRAQDKVVVDID
jgi:hypothetical protein